MSVNCPMQVGQQLELAMSNTKVNSGPPTDTATKKNDVR